jgi:hypothetical protein
MDMIKMVSLSLILMIVAVVSILIVIYIIARNLGLEPIPYISTPLDYMISRPFKLVNSAIDSISGQDTLKGQYGIKGKFKYGSLNFVTSETVLTGKLARTEEKQLSRATYGDYKLNNRAVHEVYIDEERYAEGSTQTRKQQANLFENVKEAADDGEVVVLEGEGKHTEVIWKSKGTYHVAIRGMGQGSGRWESKRLQEAGIQSDDSFMRDASSRYLARALDK